MGDGAGAACRGVVGVSEAQMSQASLRQDSMHVHFHKDSIFHRFGPSHASRASGTSSGGAYGFSQYKYSRERERERERGGRQGDAPFPSLSPAPQLPFLPRLRAPNFSVGRAGKAEHLPSTGLISAPDKRGLFAFGLVIPVTILQPASRSVLLLLGLSAEAEQCKKGGE